MKRRHFVHEMAVLGVAANLAPDLLAADTDLTASSIPRWRGFNLQGRFGWPGHPYDGPAFEESDFATMAEWGFDFARLPLAYWTWGSRDDWSQIREEPLRHVDAAVELGKQYGVHVNVNFHRIPGYCINGRELEPHDLFSGKKADRQKALDAAVFHWKAFARRYKGIANKRLSFDLINEPPKMRSYEGYLEERYEEIVRALVAGIREVDPSRLIVADGLDIGQVPVPGIADLGLVQSTRGYQPKAVSHYTATWVPREEFETMSPPTWPLKDDKGVEKKLKPLVITILDARGCVKMTAAQDGASLMRAESAHGKAYGALAMGRGSRALFQRAQEQAYFVDAVNTMAQGRLVPVPGGVLIQDGTKLLGAIGVSGDTSDNDEICAVAGIEAAGLKANTG